MKAGEGIDQPNGIQLSRDEKTLFVNNTRGEYLIAFDIQADGTLTNKRNFAKYEGTTKGDNGFASGADGLAVDSEGRVYVAINTTGGVQVFSPQGQHLGTIPTSSRARRTSRLPAPTRRRCTSSAAARHSRSRCCRRVIRDGPNSRTHLSTYAGPAFSTRTLTSETR